MQEYIALLEQIVQLEGQKKNLSTHDIFSQIMKIKRQFAKEHNIADVPTNTKLLQIYRQAIEDGKFYRSVFLEQVLRKRAVRSQSGIVPIQVLTKPFWCPGQCIFCPNDPTMPKSYIKTEPGAMRALMNQFDPYKQVYNRLLSLYRTGHDTDKIEMIVLGGTWDVYPLGYKEEFLKGLYDACNTFQDFLHILPTLDKNKGIKILSQNNDDTVIGMPEFSVSDLSISYPDTIQDSIHINQTAQHRIIGLTIETRPEYVTDENCRLWRNWGVTRLEMGLQSMFDDVLDANKRGHSVQQARDAVHKMRQYGFKFSIHFMPGLYGSNVEKDIASFQLAYADPWIKPDEIKFYPTSVIPDTALYKLYTDGNYNPLTQDELKYIIKEVQHTIIPPYTRIKRLIRDIPSQEIVAGSDITNLRQITEREMIQENIKNSELRKELYNRLYENPTYCASIDQAIIQIKDCFDSDISKVNNRSIVSYIIGEKIDIDKMRNYISLDTRAREMRQRKDTNPMYIQMILRVYTSSVGKEIFISFEDDLGYIYGFTRLLLPYKNVFIDRDGLGKDTALIRELHVYGQVVKIQKQENNNTDTDHDMVQHTGLGTQLMQAAEIISRNTGYKRLSVISGVGVREYYRKLGYYLDGTYMVTDL